MKKILSIVIVALLSTAIFAQDVTTPTTDVVVNKKGEALLPVKGDIGLGVDALPFLNYLGNFIGGGAGTNTLAFPAAKIFGRYYIADDMAIRADLDIANTSITTKTNVDDLADAALKTVVDKSVVKNRYIGIGLGIQKSRGYGRLRGNYGLIVNYNYTDGSTVNEYGNPITATNVGPRNLSVKQSATNAISAGPILGVEYYIAPKICIGGEVNLLYGGTFANSYTETVSEAWTAGAVVKTTTKEEETTGIGATKTTNGFFSTSGFGCIGGLYVIFNF